jgi:pyruvate formate lyase activating enzyme
MKEALFYETVGEKDVHCFLCPHHCRIKPGDRGMCGVRENNAGRLHALTYARPVAIHLDPIEKKPLYHFYPGSTALSFGTMGCNFHCSFCQNADIAQAPFETGHITGSWLSPEEVVDAAVNFDSETIAFTYTEPTVFMEYALETAQEARLRGLRNVFITNGFMSTQALDAIVPYLDAANVDLKAYDDDFYREQCGARLKPVLETIRSMKAKGVWVELTTLIIPDLNDDLEELRRLAEFIAMTGEDIPWHVSAFHPAHRLLDRGSTHVDTLRIARRIGKEAGLKYVYIGNTPDEEGRHTFCPGCGIKLIDRSDYVGQATPELVQGACARCAAQLHGVGLIGP